jgi:hypothetical protein
LRKLATPELIVEKTVSVEEPEPISELEKEHGKSTFG